MNEPLSRVIYLLIGCASGMAVGMLGRLLHLHPVTLLVLCGISLIEARAWCIRNLP